jgi:hypothetical protein
MQVVPGFTVVLNYDQYSELTKYIVNDEPTKAWSLLVGTQALPAELSLLEQDEELQDKVRVFIWKYMREKEMKSEQLETAAS